MSDKPGNNEVDWSTLPRDDLQAMRILDAESKKALDISKDKAEALVRDRQLEDGIYTLANESGEAYIVVKSGELSGAINFPPDSDIGYIMRGTGAKFMGVIEIS